jgi:hypothetical protein
MREAARVALSFYFPASELTILSSPVAEDF